MFFCILNRINGINNKDEEDTYVRRSFVVEFQYRGTGHAILSGWSTATTTAASSSSPSPPPSSTTATTAAAVRSKRFVAHGHLNPGL
jgi:hypothetical protein